MFPTPAQQRSVLLSLLVSGSAVAQGWSQLPTAANPGDNRDGAAAFDLITNSTLLFGGFPALGQTWLHDGVDWQQAAPATAPPGRRNAAMATDLGRGRIVMFGGQGATGRLGDTWEWDGSDWIAAATSGPPARLGHVMAYDIARGVTVLFGGTSDPLRPNTLRDTWEWNGTTWTQVATANAPVEAEFSSMCYDLARGVCVLTGGTSLFGAPDQKTWEYDGTNWTDVSAAVGPAPSATPGLGLSQAQMVYDPMRQVCILHGGRTPNGTHPTDTWEYDGTAWSLVASGTPSARTGFAMAFDLGRNRVLLYGGATGNLATSFRETWAYAAGTPGSYAAFGAGCAGSAGVATNTAAAPPRIGQPLVVDLGGLPAPEVAVLVLGLSNGSSAFGALPLDLAPFGAPGCAARVRPDTSVLLLGAAGAASFTLSIPGDATLVGTPFYTQAFVIDAGANALGAVVSDAAAAVIGS